MIGLCCLFVLIIFFITATGYKEANEIWEEYNSKIDVILMDYRMPVMLGDELLVQLREKGFEGQCFMVSSSIRKGDEKVKEVFKKKLICEFDDIISKPLDVGLLLELI